MSELPAELTAKPLALIGVTGLDTVNNAIHRLIWDAFSNNRRPDSAAVQFKLLSNAHEFPTVKPKRNSYEWYIPKGILKRNWMNKYLNDIPSVVVIFYDLDWNDSMWNEKKIECASRVQSLRAAIEGRSTKIAVVLIQHGAPPQPGAEDAATTERATALCAACELPAKSLYVLPHGDHLLGYTLRLENAFYDLAQNFYHLEARIVKNHRDHLNKTTHQYLFVRHQFKMGFLNELKQDQHMAHKHYQLAYNNLLDIRMVDTNALEIKTVASFINYKLCRLMFNLNLPRDAISQFRAHTDRFKLKVGPKELMFEHHAWMSGQFSTFAELFDEAIRQGLPAVQTQHPGYYFQLAAQHATLRQTACRDLCKDVNEYPEPDPLAGQDKLEYYGQRPWRPGKLSAEPADMAREAAAIQALQHKEKTTVNHSMIIIGLLGHAISQFKTYRCPRMRRHLVVQMADEYYNSRDYGKALTLLMHMLWDYRGERWPGLLTDILTKALRAAYLSTSLQDYLTLALEALGPTSCLPKDHQAAIYTNISNILQKNIPNPEPHLPETTASLAMEKWNIIANKSEPFVITIDANNMATFMEVKARFTQKTYTVRSNVTIEVFIRNLYHQSMEFSKVSVTVNSPGYSSEFAVSDIQDKPVIFQEKETKKFLCQFQARQQDVGNEIQISTVSLYLGSDSNRCLIMRFSALGGENNVLDRTYPEIQQIRGSVLEFDNMRPLVSAEIEQEKSSIKILADSATPGLLGEWLPININLSTSEQVASARLSIVLVPDGGNDQSTELRLSTNTKQEAGPITVDIPMIEKDQAIHKIVYIRAHSIGNRNIIMKVDYSNIEEVKYSREITYNLPMVKPFDITTQFYTTLFEPISKGFVYEPFIMMPNIICSSPSPITILGTCIELGDSMQREDEEVQESVLSGITLCNGEAGSEAYCIIPKAGSEQPASTGVYTIQWRRTNSPTDLVTSSSVTLSPLWVEETPIGLVAKLPAHGSVRTPLCVSYYLRNYSDYMITLQLTMDASDAFMFAGQKQVEVCILPQGERKIEWVLRPLVAGSVALPMLTLAMPSGAYIYYNNCLLSTQISEDDHKVSRSRLGEMLERSLPSHIYIMPQSQSV
ncbi:trafficking protein particle complex subunit 11 isoform X1 [Neodiprion fabricii]|uniref:trafficking protein particle complex subunit 11 isoform X1 n=1 Tax=Neodiprion fabricii TaxID=2872261 RepID=UPI001ED8FEE2|nr:trafficking protein particle complex subunit 11 isoform X1 [Neodiprion fabricii]